MIWHKISQTIASLIIINLSDILPNKCNYFASSCKYGVFTWSWHTRKKRQRKLNQTQQTSLALFYSLPWISLFFSGSQKQVLVLCLRLFFCLADTCYFGRRALQARSAKFSFHFNIYLVPHCIYLKRAKLF